MILEAEEKSSALEYSIFVEVREQVKLFGRVATISQDRRNNRRLWETLDMTTLVWYA